MKSLLPGLAWLTLFAVLPIAHIGCGPKHEGWYDADVKLVSGNDSAMAEFGEGKSSETYQTAVYIACKENSIDRSITDCRIRKIIVDNDSSLYVNIGLGIEMGSGPFVDKDGPIDSHFHCGSYPGIDNIQICVRPYKKTK